jgi:hypothetical protein
MGGWVVGFSKYGEWGEFDHKKIDKTYMSVSLGPQFFVLSLGVSRQGAIWPCCYCLFWPDLTTGTYLYHGGPAQVPGYLCRIHPVITNPLRLGFFLNHLDPFFIAFPGASQQVECKNTTKHFFFLGRKKNKPRRKYFTKEMRGIPCSMFHISCPLETFLDAPIYLHM